MQKVQSANKLLEIEQEAQGHQTSPLLCYGYFVAFQKYSTFQFFHCLWCENINGSIYDVSSMIVITIKIGLQNDVQVNCNFMIDNWKWRHFLLATVESSVLMLIMEQMALTSFGCVVSCQSSMRELKRYKRNEWCMLSQFKPLQFDSVYQVGDGVVRKAKQHA